MKKIIFMFFCILLSACGTEESKNYTENTETKQTPIVKLINLKESFKELESVSFGYNIIDADSDSFTINVELDNDLGEISINESENIIYFKSSEVEEDTEVKLTITVTDDSGLSSSDTTSFIIENIIYETPIVKFKNSLSQFNELETVVFNYEIIDSDSESFVVEASIDSNIGSIILNEEIQTISFTSEEIEEDTNITLKIKVTDDKNLFSEESVTFTVKNIVYQPPVIELKNTIREFNELETIIFSYTITDPDSEEFNVEASIDSNIGTINLEQSNKTISFTSEEIEEDKEVTLTVRVTDDKGLYSEDEITFTVKNIIYKAPILSLNIQKNIINEGDNFNFSYNITDEDSDIKDINIKAYATLIEGNTTHNNELGEFIIDLNNQSISFIPNLIKGDQEYYIGVIATDNQNLTDLKVFTLIINEAINNKPSIIHYLENENIEEGDTLNFSFTIEDKDENDKLTYTHGIYLNTSCYYIEGSNCTDITNQTNWYFNNDTFEVSINYDFYTPSQELYLVSEISDEFSETFTITPFKINKKNEDLIPEISILNVNEYIDFDSLEILETDDLYILLNFDSKIGDIFEYTFKLNPVINFEGIQEIENNLVKKTEGEFTVNEEGNVKIKIPNLNINGDTEVTLTINLLNEYGYGKVKDLNIKIIENVVREFENFEEEFNKLKYEYAERKSKIEENIIYEFYIDYLLVKNIISLSDKKSYINNFNELRSFENQDIENDIINISDILSKDNIDYNSAQSIFLNLKNKVDNYGLSLIQEINNKETLDRSSFLPKLREDNFSLEENSRFIGNTNYGLWINEEKTDWIFYENYKILEILQSNLTKTCKGV